MKNLASKITKKIKLIPRQISFLLGIVLFLFSLVLRFDSNILQVQSYVANKFKQQEILEQASTPTPTPITESFYPKKMIVATLDINLDIIEGGIVNDEWVIDDQHAFYLKGSGKLGEGYNTVIYGHKRPYLLTDLKQIQLEDEIILIDEQNQSYTYKVFFIEVTSSNNLEAIKSEDPDTITIFTCDGIYDQKRLIVKAKLKHSNL